MNAKCFLFGHVLLYLPYKGTKNPSVSQLALVSFNVECKKYSSYRMEYKNVITKMFVVFSLYLFIMYQCRSVQASHGNGNNPEPHRPRLRSNSRFRQASQYSRLKPDNVVDFLADDDDLFELSKRQSSDDYGHLRFGKRGEEQFDDYGHMRFGRAGGNEK